MSGRFKNVLSFEPNPLFCEVRRFNLKFKDIRNVSVHEVGLSCESDDLNYCMRYDSLGESHFLTEDSGGEATRLSVRKGDDIISETGGSVSLIKLDVEGHELQAIQGLSATIEKFKPIVLFEGLSDKDGGDIPAAIDLLRSLGLGYVYSYEPPENPYRVKIFKAGFRVVAGFGRSLRSISESGTATNSLLLIASPKAL